MDIRVFLLPCFYASFTSLLRFFLTHSYHRLYFSYVSLTLFLRFFYVSPTSVLRFAYAALTVGRPGAGKSQRKRKPALVVVDNELRTHHRRQQGKRLGSVSTV